MGKYMKKAKISADVAVSEFSQSTLGVRTRAKTLALRRLQSSSSAAAQTLSHFSDSSCYLQLRSRRLVKPSLLKQQSREPTSEKENCERESDSKPNPKVIINVSVNSDPAGSGPNFRPGNEEGCFGSRAAEEIGRDYDLSVEASFGENNLDFEPRESRSTRESTPCSLIRDVDVATPGSSTRRTTENALNQRTRSSILGDIPSMAEIEEFFAHAAQQQQRQFIEKYNFDILNDMPLPGRYDWVRVAR